MELSPESLIDVHSHIGVEVGFYLRGFQPYGLDWPTLSGMSRRAGIRQVVVFPMPTYLGSEALGTAGIIPRIDGISAGVPYAFENLRQARELGRFPDTGVRALPFWMVDPERACDEQVLALRKLRSEHSCFGFKMQGTIIRSRVLGLLHQGGCLLDLAEEWDLPFLIHSSIDPTDTWSQASDILSVVRARPKVRFILAHSCRFDVESLNEIASLPNAWFDPSAHGIHCTLAVADSPAVATKERRFDSDYSNPARVLADLACAYPDKLCWGSDAPFDSYMDDQMSLPGGYDAEISYLKQLSADALRRVANKNTNAFLGLKN